MEKLSGQNQMGAGHVRVREGVCHLQGNNGSSGIIISKPILIMAVDPYL